MPVKRLKALKWFYRIGLSNRRMTHKLWVIMSRTYAYSLANHILSTFAGLTTWLRPKLWFEIMEFHKKLKIQNAIEAPIINQHIIVFRTISPWSTIFNDELPSGCIINRGWNHIFWKADNLNICKTYLFYQKLATEWCLNHIKIVIYQNFAHHNSSILKSNFRANLTPSFLQNRIQRISKYISRRSPMWSERFKKNLGPTGEPLLVRSLENIAQQIFRFEPVLIKHWWIMSAIISSVK